MSIPKIDSSSKSLWYNIADTLTTPIATTAASIVAYPFFMCKGAAQQGSLITFKEACKKPGKWTWIAIFAGTSWLQIELLNIFQERIFKPKENATNSFSKLAPAFFSSFGVGIFSIPLLSVVNSLSIGQTIGTSLAELSWKTSLSILTRETCFVSGIAGIDLLKEPSETRKGPFLKYTVAIASGTFASIVSQPFDSVVTLLQAKKKIVNISQLMKGSLWRAAGIGLFMFVYAGTQDGMKFSINEVDKHLTFRQQK